MPRYKYKCDTCKLTDVRSLDSRMDYELVSTGERVAICPSCEEPLERVWLRPPQGWFGNGQTRA
jgi:hypothetical protein